MSATAAPERGAAFCHEALFYGSDDEFLSGTLEFIREGTRAGEPVLAVVDARKIEILSAELNGDAGLVRFVEMQTVGQNPARIIPLWRDFVDEHVEPGQAARGIGEPVWPGRTGPEISECQRHEALLNVAFEGGSPWSLLCPYDASALPDDVLEEARRSHPVVTHEGASHSYDAEAMRRPYGGELPEPFGDVRELRYGAGEIADVRKFVRGFAAERGLGLSETENLVLAASELATNSVRHATGAGSARVWTEGGTLFCEIRDAGLIEDPLVGRVVPPVDALGGRGVWIVNQLCDLVQVRSSGAGTAVRVHIHIT
jgi:anti-sigma regulatory factor (Ser/Thr protein kinase)